MRGRGLAWPLAVLSCAVVVAGVVLLWVVAQPGIGLSVGVPTGATLAASVVLWAGTAPPRVGQSSLEQLELARQVLADRGIEQLRGLARPTRAELALPPLSQTLRVGWVASTSGEIDDAARYGTADIAIMANRLRHRQARRLVVLGGHGSGKTTLARLLMVELLEHLNPTDPVPVFLPLTAWNPSQLTFSEWIVRQISDIAPELQYKARYGSGAVAGLICQGKVLPILDGLDAIPWEYRSWVLTSDEFLMQPQVILTCRTEEFRKASEGCSFTDAVLVTPGLVRLAEAKKFLSHAASEPSSWECVFKEVSNDPQGYLGRALSSPRIIYLARAAFKHGNPRHLIESPAYTSQHDVEDRILRALAQSQLSANESWADSYPWSTEKTIKWLGYLAEEICNPHTGDFAWWSVFHAVPGLYKKQALVRALASSLAAFGLITFFNMYHGHFIKYAWLTGTAYALAIGSACSLLSPRQVNKSAQIFQHSSYISWIRHKRVRSLRIISASLAAGSLFGIVISIRAHILHGGHPNATGLVDGIVAGIVIAVIAIIAQIPSASPSAAPTRPARVSSGALIDRESHSGPPWVSIGVATRLGILLGVISGVLAAIEHQGDHGGPHIGKALAYGIIMGLDVAAGAWFVSLARARTVSSRLTDPYSAYRAERSFTLLAVIILGMTFASAFSLNSSLGWSHYSTMPDAMVGIIGGTLVSEWPFYVATVSILVIRRKLPLRLIRFLELCRTQGVLQPAGTYYRFRESTPWMKTSTGEPQNEKEAAIGARADFGSRKAAPAEGIEDSTWRIVRAHLATRRTMLSTFLLTVCAVCWHIALSQQPPSGLASAELPLTFIVGAAAVIGFGVGGPSEDQGRTKRQLALQRLTVVIVLSSGAAGLFAAGLVSAHLADGPLGMLRSFAGLTGIALLSAAIFGSGLAWVMPMAYQLLTLYALEHDWTAPWIWPARPLQDLEAALCATFLFTAGVVVFTVRGVPSSRSPSPGTVQSQDFLTEERNVSHESHAAGESSTQFGEGLEHKPPEPASKT